MFPSNTTFRNFPAMLALQMVVGGTGQTFAAPIGGHVREPSSESSSSLGALRHSTKALVAESWITPEVLDFAFAHQDISVQNVAAIRAAVLEFVPAAAIAFRATSLASDEPRLVMQVRVQDGISAFEAEDHIFAALERQPHLRHAFRFLILALE